MKNSEENNFFFFKENKINLKRHEIEKINTQNVKIKKLKGKNREGKLFERKKNYRNVDRESTKEQKESKSTACILNTDIQRKRTCQSQKRVYVVSSSITPFHLKHARARIDALLIRDQVLILQSVST